MKRKRKLKKYAYSGDNPPISSIDNKLYKGESLKGVDIVSKHVDITNPKELQQHKEAKLNQILYTDYYYNEYKRQHPYTPYRNDYLKTYKPDRYREIEQIRQQHYETNARKFQDEERRKAKEGFEVSGTGSGKAEMSGFFDDPITMGICAVTVPATIGVKQMLGKFGNTTTGKVIAGAGEILNPVMGMKGNGKKGFKSEIDWGKWNKEIPKNKALMKEYNTIEQSSKANGTWMKNPDGSVFKGSPEQFVQQNSQNFKKAFPNGFKTGYRGNMTGNTHLTGDVGNNRIIFTADKETGKHYAGSKGNLFELYHPESTNSLSFNNNGRSWRNISRTPFGENPPELDILSGRLNTPQKGNYTSTDDIAEWMNSNNKDYVNIDNIFDGTDAEFVRMVNHKKRNYLKSATGNNGMFDMTNPNIYKSIVGVVAGAGAANKTLNNKQEYAMGGNIPPGYREMSKVISQRNKNKNWVERGLNPNDFPFIENEDGSQSTHKLAYSTFDDGAMVFPTIIQNEDGTLKELSMEDAYNHSIKNKTGVFIPNWDLAKYYSENGLVEHYAKGGIIKNKSIMKRKKCLTGAKLTGEDIQNLSMMTSAVGAFGNSVYDLTQAFQRGRSNLLPNSSVATGYEYAAGGNIPVEVEGGEGYELPNGQMGVFQGANHEQGGIDTELPEGTEIFSKRLKIGGRTMVERKALRELKKKKAEALLDKRKGDPITKSSFKRMMSIIESEEQADIDLMNQVNEMQQGQEQIQPEQSFPGGGKIWGRNPLELYNDYVLSENDNIFSPDYRIRDDEFKRNTEDFIISANANLGNIDLNQEMDLEKRLRYNKIYNTSPWGMRGNIPASEKLFNEHLKFKKGTTLEDNILDTPELNLDFNFVDVISGKKSPVLDNGNDKKYVPNDVKSDPYSPGDKLGMASSLFSSIASPLLTLSNRAGTKKPSNFMEDIGTDAIASLQRAKGAAGTRRQSNLLDVDAQTNAMNTTLERSARGVNTKRALRMAGESQRYKNKNQVEAQALQEQMELEKQIGGAYTDREKMRATGQQYVFDVEEAQRDAYYNALSKDMANIGKEGQNLGKNMNEAKYKEDYLNTISDMSEYFDWVMKNGSPEMINKMKELTGKTKEFGGTLKRKRKRRK